MFCMAGFANSENGSWNTFKQTALEADTANTVGISGNGGIGNADKSSFVLPEVFRRTQKTSDAAATQNTSAFNILLSAFQNGKKPSKNDLLGYQAGWYMSEHENPGEGGIIMLGFSAIANDAPDGFPRKETFTKIMYCGKGYFDNPTPAKWEEINRMLSRTDAHGPTKFAGKIASNTDNLDAELRNAWEFSVFENYLLFTRSTKTQGIIGVGYFYKRLEAPKQAK